MFCMALHILLTHINFLKVMLYEIQEVLFEWPSLYTNIFWGQLSDSSF